MGRRGGRRRGDQPTSIGAGNSIDAPSREDEVYDELYKTRGYGAIWHDVARALPHLQKSTISPRFVKLREQKRACNRVDEKGKLITRLGDSGSAQLVHWAVEFVPENERIFSVNNIKNPKWHEAGPNDWRNRIPSDIRVKWKKYSYKRKYDWYLWAKGEGEMPVEEPEPEAGKSKPKT